MPQDPWQRANELSRLHELDRGRPEPPRHSPLVPVLLALLLLAVLGTGGYFLWREYFSQPEQIEETKAEVREALPKPMKPEMQVDADALERGLGIQLRILGDYLELVAAGRELGVEWELKSTGKDSVRLKAPGVTAAAREGHIYSFELDVDEVYAAEVWDSWAVELAEMGISPSLRLEEAYPEAKAGEPVYLTGKQRVKLPDGWAWPTWELSFEQGRLARVKGGLEFGSKSTAPPVPPETQAAQGT